jgi:flagellin-like hook-associated protein FlgL
MNRAMERVETGRDFQRVSDNVTKATRAISVRERLYRNEQMTDNVNTAMEQLNMAEKALKQMNDICSNVQSEMFKCLNTPTLQAGKDSFSAFLDGAKDEIMRLANTKYNDKYVLGGLGIEVAPFKPNEEGNMEFNGVELSEMQDKTQMINSIKKDYGTSHLCTACCKDCINARTNDDIDCFTLDELKDLSKEAIRLVPKDSRRPEVNVADTSTYDRFLLGLEKDVDGNYYDESKKDDYHVVWDRSKSGLHFTIHLGERMSDTEIAKEVSDIQAETQNFYYSNGKPVKYSGDSYMDIGLDMSVAGNGKVAPKTAFRTTVDGIAAMGYGTTDVPYNEIKGLQASAGYQGSGSGSNDSETVCNNIYDMMNEMQKAIDSLDEGADISNVIDKISAVMVNFKKQTDNIIAAESEIGVRTQFLETNLDRLEAENTSLKKMQKDIETVDDATEITNFLGYQNAWNLVLQFGKNIVPKSLMDYVN